MANCRQRDVLVMPEGALLCLRTSPPLGGTLGVHRSSWCILFPRHACIFLVLAFRGAWVSHALFKSQSSAPLRMQLYPRSLDVGCPGHLHGTRFRNVVWRLGYGLGFAVTPPNLAGV